MKRGVLHDSPQSVEMLYLSFYSVRAQSEKEKEKFNSLGLDYLFDGVDVWVGT